MLDLCRLSHFSGLLREGQFPAETTNDDGQ